MRWTRADLAQEGFVGFVSWAAMDRGQIPGDPGVYVVMRSSATAPTFLKASPGGWFKGKDPTTSDDVLTAAWIDAAEVVYIGKASSLRRRLRAYRRFGVGDPVGHWGGRYIWQLVDSQDLLVAWKPTPDASPRDVERRMIAQFVEDYGRRPFANLRG